MWDIFQFGFRKSRQRSPFNDVFVAVVYSQDLVPAPLNETADPQDSNLLVSQDQSSVCLFLIWKLERVELHSYENMWGQSSSDLQSKSILFEGLCETFLEVFIQMMFSFSALHWDRPRYINQSTETVFLVY